MKIAIMGSGGIGGYYGGRLAQAGEDVTFIARGAHLAALREKGLTVHSHFGDFSLPPVQATDTPAEVGPVELVVLATKAYDLETAAEAIRPLLGPGSTVLPLLNGVDIVERIAALIGAEPVLGGLCGISSAIAGPGVIRQVSTFDFVTLGEQSGKVTPRAQAVERVFRQASRTVKLSTDIRLDIWHKFLFLASSAGVCSVTRQMGGPVRSDPDTRAMLAEAIAEIAAVGRKTGVALEEDAAERTLAQIDGMVETMKPSMALDLERGNRLELDALTGTVVRLGKQHGVPTPVNRFIYAALKLHKDGRA